MTKPAAFRQADVTRLIRGALKGGLPVGSFTVVVENGLPKLVPVAANAPLNDAEEIERRIRGAFSE